MISLLATVNSCMVVFNPRLARNVESENESTLKVKMKVGFSLFILLRRSQARVKNRCLHVKKTK